MRSLTLLRKARVSTGSIVLLDGQEVGSVLPLDEVIGAEAQQVRVFTVGLRSQAFDASTLRTIADRTEGTYAEARSAAELQPIYEALGAQLAGEYLIRYRSVARPNSDVTVDVRVAGRGRARHELRGADAVTASVPPIARVEVPALGKLAAADQPGVRAARLRAAAPARAAAEIHRRRPCTDVRARDFLRAPRPATAARCGASRNQEPYASGWWAQLERDLELARMTASPKRVVGIALLGTFSITLLALMLSAPLLALFGLTTPFITHGRAAEG